MLACGSAGGVEPTIEELRPRLEMVPDGHRLLWTSKNNFLYHVEVSHDLLTWEDVGVALPGTGEVLSHDFPTLMPRAYYRILPVEDPENRGFLMLPQDEQSLDAIDGVVFAFDLGVLGELPERIMIHYRMAAGESTVPDDWQLIGTIHELAERDGTKFVRGSVVWLPPAEGEFEVWCVAEGVNGEVMAAAERRITVGSNRPPEVVITGGPPASSEYSQPMEFTTDVVDEDGDLITRVEFFNHGVLVGTDWEAPFGDYIIDLENQRYDLLRGNHTITAIAYDSRGGISAVSEPWLVEVTAGNARPELVVYHPPQGYVLQRGDLLDITFAAEDADGLADIREVVVRNIQNHSEVRTEEVAAGALAVETSDWEAGSHVLVVQAFDDADAASIPHYIGVYIRDGTGPSFADLLVEKIACGASVLVSNAEFQGAELSSGIFEDGLASGLQMDSGVLLTTGLFSLWNGGNTSGATGYSWGNPGDARLRDRITDGSQTFTTHDAAALEFDVVATSSQLEFDFQFGSEEYPEYTGRFNDGLLITVDDVIVSLVTDGSDIISVNSVNSIPGYDRHSHLYLDNHDDIEPSVAKADLHRLVEYDGMSVKLRGHVLVEPGRTYRMRIVIADAIDEIYDSGIFIEENSIRSATPGVVCPP